MEDLLAVIIGLVLLAAGVEKLLAGHDTFHRIVRGYRLVGSRTSAIIARALPFVEIGVGFGLVILMHIPVLAWVAAALFASFAVAIAVNLVRGRSGIPCGCFGQTDETIGTGALFRALLLFGAAVATHLVDVPVDLDVARPAYVGLVWTAAATLVLFFTVVRVVTRINRLGRDLLPIVEAMDRENSWFENGGNG